MSAIARMDLRFAVTKANGSASLSAWTVAIARHCICCDHRWNQRRTHSRRVGANGGGRFGPASELPKPAEWLSDNSSGYIAHETRAFARDIGLVPRRAPYRSPQSNGMAESFVKTFKRDYVAMHAVSTAEIVLKQLPTWFADYNLVHPHRALKYRSLEEFRQEEFNQIVCPVL